MEFVEGGNLREILQIRKKLSVPEALRILEDAAAGLTYAYARGVTHRDIKLTNLLISSHGRAPSWWTSAWPSSSRPWTRNKEKVDRTVDYAGLEKATNVKTGDVRSDIFFLGCVFYEMLTGRSPLAMTRDKQRPDAEAALRQRSAAAARRGAGAAVGVPAVRDDDGAGAVAALPDAVAAAGRGEGGAARRGRPGRRRPRPAAARPPTAGRSLFVVEGDERLQDAVRDKFKEMGFRVLISTDPQRRPGPLPPAALRRA